MSTPKTGAQSSKRIKKWWIKERYNPQLGTYYIACGQTTGETTLRVKGQKVQ